jgi:uncharacterized protein YcfL
VRTTHRTLLSALGLGLGLLLAACSSTRIGHDKDQDTYRASEGFAQTEVDRGDVRMDEVTVEAIRSTRPSGGRLQVQFDLVSSARYRVPFEWRLRWFDAAGAELDGPDHWRPTTLEVKETRPMTVTAPVPSASAWEIALRSRHESN